MARFIEGTLDLDLDVKATKKDAPKPSFARGVDASPESAFNSRSNKYPGRCIECSGWVGAGEGLLTKDGQGKWAAQHKPGNCWVAFDRESTQPKPEPVAFSVPDGTYTVVWADGHKTIRVRTQDAFDDFMPSTVILSFLSGPDNTSSYTQFAHVKNGEVRFWKKHQTNERLREAVKLLLGDPKAAAKAYAVESGNCGLCGRELTTPESLSRGFGPTCAQKFGG